MSQQLTSEEQFSVLRSFLAKTWKIFVAVIVIGLLAFWGWRYWQSYQEQKITDASDKYEQLVKQLDATIPTSVDALVAFANDKENKTIYNVFADLRAAQFYVEALKNYEGAEALLANALTKTDSQPIQSIIYIRIARLQYQLAQYQDSLASLDKVLDKSWASTVNDLRGEIFVKMARYADAIDSFQVALSSSPAPEVEKNIRMKLNQAEYLKAKQLIDDEKQAAKESAENSQQKSDAASKPAESEKPATNGTNKN
ncbi:tetratricopeptide repeat protein [Orbaceae bacterium ESL0727]|nr:tetratricopeptide repeat protein [Orbaceae bacterium ESL0727]